MEQLFWACLGGGILFTLVTALLGDLVSHMFHGALDFMSADYLNPMVLASSITVFGGMGVMLMQYSPLPSVVVLLLAMGLALVIGGLIGRFYIRPMRRTENSTGYSMSGLTGRVGEVITPIPQAGYGEVLVRAGIGMTNQIAASFDGKDIQAGARVVIVEVRDGTVYVSRFENKER